MVNKNSSYLIQSNFGTKGNFEVVVVVGQELSLQHWYRNNDDPNLPWVSTGTFASEVSPFP